MRTSLMALCLLIAAPGHAEYVIRQVTSSGTDAQYPRIAPDGSFIIFQSADDLTSENPQQLNQYYFVLRSGAGLRQLTGVNDPHVVLSSLDISPDGTQIKYLSERDPPPADPESALYQNRDLGNCQLNVQNLQTGIATVVVNAVEDTDYTLFCWAALGAGWIEGTSNLVALSTFDLVGANPDGSREIFAIDTQTFGINQITSGIGDWYGRYDIVRQIDSDRFLAERARSYSVLRLSDGQEQPIPLVSSSVNDFLVGAAVASQDGGRLFFSSDGDFTGDNPDFSEELFELDLNTFSVRQLSDSGNFENFTQIYSLQRPAESPNIYFVSDGNIAGLNPSHVDTLFAYNPSQETFRSISLANSNGDLSGVYISADATRVLYFASTTINGKNVWSMNAKTIGSPAEQVIFDFPRSQHYLPPWFTLSTDLRTIAFHSDRDLTGNNADRSAEVFIARYIDPPDSVPGNFYFIRQRDVRPSTPITSNAVTVEGINVRSRISIVNGTYSINGSAFTNTAGLVMNGDLVRVRHRSAATLSGSVRTTLTIGGVSANFVSHTILRDTTPDRFGLVDRSNVVLARPITSNRVTISGINTATLVSIKNGFYSINGAAFTNKTGTIRNGDNIRVRHKSASTPATSVRTVLTVGGVPSAFISTTTTTQ